MSVRGRSVVHCRGSRRGRVIKTHKTRAGALRQHRAIQANKKRKAR